jgi:hypothetical protein
MKKLIVLFAVFNFSFAFAGPGDGTGDGWYITKGDRARTVRSMTDLNISVPAMSEEQILDRLRNSASPRNRQILIKPSKVNNAQGLNGVIHSRSELERAILDPKTGLLKFEQGFVDIELVSGDIVDLKDEKEVIEDILNSQN